MLRNLKLSGEGEPGVRKLLALFLLVLAGSFLVSVIISRLLWANYTNTVHTAMELTCVYIALSSFFVVWHNHNRCDPVDIAVGFGFLAVAVFDIFHTYYFPGLNLFPAGYNDLSTRYWILGRLTEAAVLVICSRKMLIFKSNKWVALTLVLGVATALSYLVLSFPGMMPVLYTGQNMTTPKIFLEYVVIAFFLTGLWNLRNKLGDKGQITYRYVFMALLLAIPGELNFTLVGNITSFYNTLGHVLKVVYYYYLYRGIFVSAVTYPYEKAENLHLLFHHALDELPLGIMTFPGNVMRFLNKKGEEILGCKSQDLFGLPLDKVMQRIFISGQPFSTEDLAVNGLSKEHLVELTTGHGGARKAIISWQRHGEGLALLLFREAKQEQEFENIRLQTLTILEALDSMVVITDQEDRVIMCNRAFQEAVEVEDPGEIIGMQARELVKELQFCFQVEKRMPASMREKEASFVSRKGKRKDIIFNRARVFNLDGELIGYVYVASDVTDMLIEKQKLQQWEKLALLGEMAAGIVHEIRNPLTAIKGFSQLLLFKAGNPGLVQEYACIIDRETTELNKIITDFLAFARPRSPVFREVDLNELVKAVKIMTEGKAFIEQNIVMHLNVSPLACRVWADEAQLKQVMLNLIKNALEAMQHIAHPRLSLETGANDRGEVYIAVSDNGKGMTPEERLKAGTPFFTTKDRGTGLGLSVSYQIIKEHNGRIEVETAKGEGTKFAIYLPSLALAKAL